MINRHILKLAAVIFFNVEYVIGEIVDEPVFGNLGIHCHRAEIFGQPFERHSAARA